MPQSIFDALTGVSLDSSTVQSLLESQTLITEVEQSAIDQDDHDIFQCGKCKSQFTSLHVFLLHKREHMKVQEQNVDLSEYLVSDEGGGASGGNVHCDDPCADGTSYDPRQTFVQAHQLGQPIILEETDMLFSMDQEGANYLTQDSGFGVPIILNADNLDGTFVEPSENAESNNDDPIATNNDSLNNDLTQDEPVFDISSNHEIVNMDNGLDNVIDDTNDQDDDSNVGQMQNLKYKCGYCDKQFAKKFYWQQHERSHTGEKPYQCVVCGRAFAQKSNVKKHMSSHKVWPGTAIHSLPPEAPADGSIDRTYHCQFCKDTFDSYKSLKGHLILSHLTLKVYKCVQTSCSMMFSELDDFLEHTKSHESSEYRCHVCGIVFDTLTDLGMHQYAHTINKQMTTEKYYRCGICKSSFSNVEALSHHTETESHDYPCAHCGKSFLIERFLRRHLKTHVAAAKFGCDDCGKAFKTEQYLANHRLIHSEETPFVCPQCPARFKRKDRLGRHMLIHDLTKWLKCPFRGYLGCMSEFSRPDKLKRHMLTHSNIKRFSCGHCNRNFHRAQALKHHELNKHVVKCDICSYNFKTKEQLVNHNCDQTIDTKRHTSSQIPRKASGTFKPRKPTPKRQMKLGGGGSVEKEKIRADESIKKETTDELRMTDDDENSCEKKLENFTIIRETVTSSPFDGLVRVDTINCGRVD